MTFSNRRRRTLAIALRVALGAMFVYAAWAKLRIHWVFFAGAIADYKILPSWMVEPLARTLPWAELAIGILLIAGVLLRPVALAGTALLAGFFALMVRSYVMHMEISCGCFGPTGDPISWKTLVRDGAFLAVSAVVTWNAFRKRKTTEETAAVPAAASDLPA
jgi:uncharacterized membrane protein YphA (DoxX/SURF4 family)